MKNLLLTLAIPLLVSARAEGSSVLEMVVLSKTTVSQKLANACNIQTLDAYDPRLPRPSIAQAQEAFVHGGTGAVLGYAYQSNYSLPNISWVAANGAELATVYVTAGFYQASGIEFATSSYLVAATPNHWPGTQAGAFQVFTPAGRGYNTTCRGFAVDFQTFSGCVELNFVDPLVRFYCSL